MPKTSTAIARLRDGPRRPDGLLRCRFRIDEQSRIHRFRVLTQAAANVFSNIGATAMFAVVLVALAIAVAMLTSIGPHTAGRSLEDINPL